MPVFKVKVDGTEHEVEQDAIALPEGVQLLTNQELGDTYITKAAHDAQMGKLRTSTATEVRKAQEGRFTPEELLSDEHQEAFQEFVDLGREKLAPLVGAKLTDEDRTRMRDQLEKNWTKTKLEPVQEKLEERDKKITRLLGKGLRGAISTAASQTGVKGTMVEFLVPRYEKLARYDDEHQDWFILDSDGESFKPNTNTSDGQPPFLPIEEDLRNRRASGEWADIFDPKHRDGVGVTDGKNQRGGGVDGLEHIKVKADAKTVKEKTQFIKKRGEKAWEALPLK